MLRRKGQAINRRILGCPRCRKRYETFKALNQHLLKRHNAEYILRPPASLVSRCRALPRPKRRAYNPVDQI